MKKTLASLLAFSVWPLCGAGTSSVRLKELVTLEGVRDNQLLGYGLVVGLARTVAREAGPYNIRVNCVHPGSIPTKLLLHETVYKVFRPHLDAPTLDDCLPVFGKLNMLPDAFQQRLTTPPRWFWQAP